MRKAVTVALTAAFADPARRTGAGRRRSPERSDPPPRRLRVPPPLPGGLDRGRRRRRGDQPRGLVRQPQARRRGRAKWLKDMRQWWRRIGRETDMPLDGVSGATAPGRHPRSALRRGAPAPFAALKPGAYELVVEAAREVGGREVVRLPLAWPPTPPRRPAAGRTRHQVSVKGRTSSAPSPSPSPRKDRPDAPAPPRRGADPGPRPCPPSAHRAWMLPSSTVLSGGDHGSPWTRRSPTTCSCSSTCRCGSTASR